MPVVSVLPMAKKSTKEESIDAQDKKFDTAIHARQLENVLSEFGANVCESVLSKIEVCALVGEELCEIVRLLYSVCILLRTFTVTSEHRGIDCSSFVIVFYFASTSFLAGQKTSGNREEVVNFHSSR